MFKKLRFPLLALVAFQFAVAPAAHAEEEYDKSLYKKLLKKIYADSERGDGGDIFQIIRKSLVNNPSQGSELVDRLIDELEENLDQLAFDVSEDDLKRIKRQLSRFLKRRQANFFVSTPTQGNVTPPESGVTNN